MSRIQLALGTQSNKGKSPLEGVARLVNCRIEIGGDEQRVKVSTQAVAGLTLLANLSSTGGIRAAIEVDGVGYAVVGRVIYQFEAGGTYSVIGGMPSDGLVTMARNARGTGAQVLIVCDGIAKYIDNGSLVDVVDTDLGAPNSCCSLANVFVTSSADGYLRSGEINDASDWDGLDITQAQSDPDGLLRVMAKGSSVVAFGQHSTEVWDYNGEATGFPFVRSNAFRVGCWSAASVVAAPVITRELVTDTIAWAATDRDGAYAGVTMLDGYTARKISTHSVDRDMRRCSNPASITACSYTEDGHAYMAWTIPDVTTWVYDTATGMWHERESDGESHWNIGTTMVLGGRNVGGHRSESKLYWIDPDAGDEAGAELVMTLQTPPMHAYPDQITVDALYLDCVTGVGLNTTVPANLDPVVEMDYTEDGETFGIIITRPLGRQGQSLQRLAWHGCGTTSHRGRTWRFRCSAAVNRSFQLLSADVEKITA